jgi:hypothetical protein
LKNVVDVMVSKRIKYFFNEANNEEPLKSCLEQVFDYLFESCMTLNNILFVTIFVNKIENFREYVADIEKILFNFGFDVPHIIVAQSPNNARIAFEILFIEGNFQTVNFGKSYKLIERDNLLEFYATSSVYNGTIYESSGIAFNELFNLLKRFRISAENIVRQWNYIEDIYFHDNMNQNYQDFNELRAKYYSSEKWKYGYPAATGIGTATGCVGISLIAVKNSEGAGIISLMNPNQKDAHSYSGKVLIGWNEDKSTPKFERGKVVINSKNMDIYVSGTASIIGEETIGDNSIALQTKTTINNIFKLIGIDNLENQIPQQFHSRFNNIDLQKSFSNVRVYVKNDSDIESAEIICRESFGNVPMIFLRADICRANLLVEIEGSIFL